MNKVYRFFLVVCLMNGASTVAAERVITVEPGLWEYTHSLAIPGLLQPLSGPKTECVTPEDALRRLDDLLEELSKGGGCSVSNLKDTLNTVKFDLECRRDIESISLNSVGHLAFRYGRTKITGSATGVISVNGVELNMAATGLAKRVGRCKK